MIGNQSSSAVKFSIVIPSFNRPEKIRDCVAGLSRLEYTEDAYEIIIVDDGSSPAVSADSFRFARPVPLRVLKQQNAGPASARNTGAAAAKGEYIVFTDDDCVPEPNYLLVAEAELEETPLAVLGGHTVNALPGNWCAEASQLLVDYLYEYFNEVPGRTKLFTSNNMVLPAATFTSGNNFDTRFSRAAGEDRELCRRLTQNGSELRYCPELIVDHFHSMTLVAFWKQHFNYGRAARTYHSMQGESVGPKPEPLSFYFNLLRIAFRKHGFPRSLFLSLLLLLSQVANACGFFWALYAGYRQPNVDHRRESVEHA